MPLRESGFLLLTILAACLSVFGAILLPQQTFAGMDFVNLIYPRGVLGKTTVMGGELPLWNPYEWAGSPLLAAMQGGVFYPGTWLFTYLLPLPYGQQLSTLFHLVLAGVGAAFLCRRLFETRIAPAAFCGIAYACGGFVLGRLEQLNVISTFAWTPWLFVTALRCLRGESAGAYIAVAVMAILAGHPQTLFLAHMGLGIFILASWLGERFWGDLIFVRVGRLPALAVSAIIAGLAAAAQLLPTQELSGLSERVWPYPDPYEPSLKLNHLLPSLFLPRYYNQLGEAPGRPFGFSETEIYAGMLVPVLAAAGFMFALRRRQVWGGALLMVGVFSFWFALGQQGFLARGILELVPFLKHSRGTARMLNTGTLSLCLAAGYCLHRLSAGSPIKFQWVGWAAVLLLVLDLTLVHRQELNSLLVPKAALEVRSPITDDVVGNSRVYRFMAHDSNYYLDNRAVAVYQRQLRLQPNQGSITGIPLLDGYEEGLVPTRAYANFLRRFNRNLRSDSVDAPLLAMLGSNILITDYPIPNFPGWTRVADIRARTDHALGVFKSDRKPLDLIPMETILENTSVTLSQLLRAYGESNDGPLHPGTRLVEGYPRADPGQVAEDHPMRNLGRDLKPGGGTNHLEKMSANSFKLSQSPPSGSYLCFGYSYPGWKLQIDSHVVALRPQTPLFSTLEVPALQGKPKIAKLVFRPFSFRLGLFISLCTLLVYGCFGLRRIMP